MSIEQRAARRINMGTALGQQTGNVVIKDGVPTLQLALGGGEMRSELPYLQHYGFASRPMPGARFHMAFQSGDRARGIATASHDPRYIPKDLKDGESCLYDHNGTRITLKADGSLFIKPGKAKLVIESDKISIKGNIAVEGDLELKGKLKASGTIEGQEVTAGSVKLSSHRHSNGNQGAPTGAPLP